MELTRFRMSSLLDMAPHSRIYVCLSIWLLQVSMTSVMGGFTQFCDTEGYNAQGTCGSQLANALRMLCRTRGYNVRDIGKRATVASPLESKKPLGIEGPFWPKSKALSYLHKRDSIIVQGKTYRQGIVCECCVYNCGLVELMEYCAASPATHRPTYSVSKKWRGILSSPAALTTNTDNAQTSDPTGSDTSATTGTSDDRVTTPSGTSRALKGRLQDVGRLQGQSEKPRSDTFDRTPNDDSQSESITDGFTAIHRGNEKLLEQLIHAEEQLKMNDMELQLQKQKSV